MYRHGMDSDSFTHSLIHLFHKHHGLPTVHATTSHGAWSPLFGPKPAVPGSGACLVPPCPFTFSSGSYGPWGEAAAEQNQVVFCCVYVCMCVYVCAHDTKRPKEGGGVEVPNPWSFTTLLRWDFPSMRSTAVLSS